MLLPRLAALAAEFRRACGLASPFGGFAPRALPTTTRPFRPLEGRHRADQAVKRTTAAVRRLPPCWLRTTTPGRCFGATSSQPTAVAPLPLPLTAHHLRCTQRDQTCRPWWLLRRARGLMAHRVVVTMSRGWKAGPPWLPRWLEGSASAPPEPKSATVAARQTRRRQSWSARRSGGWSSARHGSEPSVVRPRLRGIGEWEGGRAPG